jgi:transcriptional regulator with XRE-family HTH domain
MHDIGKILREIRKKKGYTLEELGRRINFNYSNLSKIERGDRHPTYELLISLSELYDVPMSYFFREKEIPKELEDSVEKWYSVIKESEDKGYTPEELKEIIKLVEKLRKDS